MLQHLIRFTLFSFVVWNAVSAQDTVIPKDSDAWEARDVWLVAIEGNETFSTEDLRSALALDGQVQSTVDIHQPLSAFHDKVIQRLTDGYVSEGFLDAVVKPQTSDKTFRVQIKEGRRYKCGPLKITGAKQVDVEFLKSGLQTKAKDDKDEDTAVWTSGEELTNTDGYLKKLRQRVSQLLLAEGFYFPEFDVAFEPDNMAATVSLHVDIASEGDRQPIDEVRITGLERHTPEEVLAFLDLPNTLYATQKQLDSVSKKLLESGRFVFVRLRTDTPFGSDDPVTLHINALEYTRVARLDEPLSRQHEVMRKMAIRLSNMSAGDDELRITIRSSQQFDYLSMLIKNLTGQDVQIPQSLHVASLEFDMLLKGTGGGIFRATTRNADNRILFDGTSVAISTWPAIVNWAEKTMWVPDDSPPSITTVAKFEGHEPDEDGRMFRMSYGVTASSDADPLSVRVFANPAAVIDIVKDEATVSFEDGQCRLVMKQKEGTDGFGEVVIDEESGKLVRFLVRAKDLELRLETVQGEFAKLLEQSQQQSQNFANSFRKGHNLSSLITFLAQGTDALLQPVKSELHPLVPVAIRLLRDPGALESVADRTEAWFGGETFSIPVANAVAKSNTEKGWMLHAIKGLVPTGSPTHRLIGVTLKRQFTGEDEPLKILLQEVIRDQDHGALTCLFSAWMLPPFRVPLSRIGLERMGDGRLPAELNEILEKPCVLRQILRSMVTVVRGLSDDEVKVLVAVIRDGNLTVTPKDRDSVTRDGIDLALPIQLIRSNPIDDPDQILRGLVTVGWTALGREKVREQLTTWASQPMTSKSVFRQASSSKKKTDKEEEKENRNKANPVDSLELPDAAGPIFQSGSLLNDLDRRDGGKSRLKF